jgi:hypothetical protein
MSLTESAAIMAETVATVDDLPAIGKPGDTYKVTSEGCYYSWETGWVRGDDYDDEEDGGEIDHELPPQPQPGEPSHPIAPPSGEVRPPIHLPDLPAQLPEFGPEGPTDEDIDKIVPPIHLPEPPPGSIAPPITLPDPDALKKRLAFILSLLRKRRQVKLSEDADDIVMEAYLFLYPLLVQEMSRRYMTGRVPPGVIRRGAIVAPTNEWFHLQAYPTAEEKVYVRPNFDTLYSILWGDLSKGPITIRIPDAKGRFYLLPMLDMWSEVFAVPGSRTDGGLAGTWTIVPKGYTGRVRGTRIESPTSTFQIIGRTRADGPSDYRAVNKWREGWEIDAPRFPWRRDRGLDYRILPPEAVERMGALEFFNYGLALLEQYGAHELDSVVLERMARIGLEPGERIKPRSDLGRLVADVPLAGQAAMWEYQKTKSGHPVDGWLFHNEQMGVWGVNYLRRAWVALTGLGANRTEDAIYPVNQSGMVGEKNYVLHFDKGKFPPARGFWSVTMYDYEGYQCANELNRFAVSSWMPFKYNSDGSLDLYIQHKNPGKDKEANWLPSPASGNLGVTMRLYWPKPEALDRSWLPPAVKEAGASQATPAAPASGFLRR